jgi:hypothetical protein
MQVAADRQPRLCLRAERRGCAERVLLQWRAVHLQNVRTPALASSRQALASPRLYMCADAPCLLISALLKCVSAGATWRTSAARSTSTACRAARRRSTATPASCRPCFAGQTGAARTAQRACSCREERAPHAGVRHGCVRAAAVAAVECAPARPAAGRRPGTGAACSSTAAASAARPASPPCTRTRTCRRCTTASQPQARGRLPAPCMQRHARMRCVPALPVGMTQRARACRAIAMPAHVACSMGPCATT